MKKDASTQRPQRICDECSSQAAKEISGAFYCWMSLKARYESNSQPYKVSLMNKFFSIRKDSSIDEYLMDMKEVTDMLEEVGLRLPESIVCYYTVINLPKEYEVIKQMIL